MRIAITGATGFIGRPLVDRLLAEGHSVHLLVRKPRPGLPQNVPIAVWDALTNDPPPEPLRQADAVIHLAGEPVAQRWTSAVKQRIRQSRTDGTRRLVEAFAAHPPRTLISASAIGFYGDRADEQLTETSAAGSGFLPEVSVQWESAALDAARLGTRVACIRIGLVLAPGGGALARMLPLFRAGIGGRIGGGRQWMSWIHRDDLVSLFIAVLGDSRYEGPVNSVAPNPVTNAEFTKILGRTLHRPALLPVPEFALRLVFGDMAQVLTASTRVIPEAACRIGFRFQYPELGPALRQILRQNS